MQIWSKSDKKKVEEKKKKENLSRILPFWIFNEVLYIPKKSGLVVSAPVLITGLRGRIPQEVAFNSWLYGAALHRSFHLYTFILL